MANNIEIIDLITDDEDDNDNGYDDLNLLTDDDSDHGDNSCQFISSSSKIHLNNRTEELNRIDNKSLPKYTIHKRIENKPIDIFSVAKRIKLNDDRPSNAITKDCRSKIRTSISSEVGKNAAERKRQSRLKAQLKEEERKKILATITAPILKSPNAHTPKHLQHPPKTLISLEKKDLLRCLLSLSPDTLQSRSVEAINESLRLVYSWKDDKNSQMLPLAFANENMYLQMFTPLIILDAWAGCIERYTNGEPLLNFVTLKCQENDNENNLFKTWTLWSKVKTKVFTVKRDSYFIENWIVIVKVTDSIRLFGFVEEVGVYQNHFYARNTLPFIETVKDMDDDSFEAPDNTSEPPFQFIRFKVRLLNDASLKNNTKSVIFLQPLRYLKPSVRLIETLLTLSQMLTRQEFFRSLLKPNLSLCLMEKPKLDKDCEFIIPSTYNKIQQEAIRGTLNTLKCSFDTNKVLLIQGPPGTGKTYTLVGLVKAIFVNLFEKGKPLRILVCAPSNGAVDEIGQRLVNDRNELNLTSRLGRTLNIVRVGQVSQVHPNMLTYHLDHLVGKLLKQDNPSNKRDPFAMREILETADVILTTLSSCQISALDMFRVQSTELAIRCVIVDEASQCSEPELLMPLIYPINKLILIGDPLQLPATVISKQAQTMGYGRSMFERFYLHFKEKGESIPMLTLENQFRMHPEIVQFPSQYFYSNILKTPPTIGTNALIPLQPYLVFDVVNTIETYGSKNHAFSKVNLQEIVFIRSLLEAIFSHLPSDHLAKSITIGIITFYKGQKKLLLDELGKIKYRIPNIMERVEVNTVDAFQGQQRDIIILSCVRAHNEQSTAFNRSVGFLQSFQRINVALTRAKSAMFVCLQAKTLEKDRHWKRLIDDAKRRNRFHSVNSKTPFIQLSKQIHFKQ